MCSVKRSEIACEKVWRVPSISTIVEAMSCSCDNGGGSVTARLVTSRFDSGHVLPW